MATSYSNIGFIYKTQEKYIEAMEYFHKGLVIMEQLYGNDMNVNLLFSNILELMAEQDNYVEQLCLERKYQEAIDYMSKALVIREKVLGEDHPSIIKYTKNIQEIEQKSNLSKQEEVTPQTEINLPDKTELKHEEPIDIKPQQPDETKPEHQSIELSSPEEQPEPKHEHQADKPISEQVLVLNQHSDKTEPKHEQQFDKPESEQSIDVKPQQPAETKPEPQPIYPPKPESKQLDEPQPEQQRLHKPEHQLERPNLEQPKMSHQQADKPEPQHIMDKSRSEKNEKHQPQVISNAPQPYQSAQVKDTKELDEPKLEHQPYLPQSQSGNSQQPKQLPKHEQQQYIQARKTDNNEEEAYLLADNQTTKKGCCDSCIIL